MVLERPKPKTQKPVPPTDRPMPNAQSANPPKKVITSGGGRGGGNSSSGGNRGGGNNSNEPSPWLLGNKPLIAPSASFVEYLRWMRSPHFKDSTEAKKEDPVTKVQVLQMAEEGVDYRALLKKRNERTRKIAQARQGECLSVKCPWRVRVGGHRGPESILLPSFDAVGVPYLPSSTLTGIARVAAMREYIREEGMTWQQADRAIAPYFGSLEVADSKNRAGKVIFLDAYPEPSKSGGLAMDMANSIWRWEGDRIGDYSPNPNPFFSLKDTTFLVGICRMSNCNDAIFAKVQQWLIQGLQEGIGSQINSGYGEALVAGEGSGREHFLEIEFDVKGQGIHGRHYFHNKEKPFRRDRQGNLEHDRNGNLKPDPKADLEVRSISFKNMLRYWFRVFSLGVLSPKQTKDIEVVIFGGIETKPPTWGWLCVRTEEIEPPDDSEDTQSGILKLYGSPSLPGKSAEAFQQICKNLTWLMFRLGGIGQGSRRPYYERNGNPKIRGCNLTPYSSDRFWQIPDNPNEFKHLFQERIGAFYLALEQLANTKINPRSLRNAGNTSRDRWYEVADSNCRIFAFRGNNTGYKCHALEVLHNPSFKKQGNYDRDLCGSTAKPSPIWIADAEDKDYQIVTVFGATQDPRKAYVDELIDLGATQIFPLTEDIKRT
jgi:CRISPR-associated protein Cmr6